MNTIKKIRLTEDTLHSIIKECVRRITSFMQSNNLNENKRGDLKVLISEAITEVLSEIEQQMVSVEMPDGTLQQMTRKDYIKMKRGKNTMIKPKRKVTSEKTQELEQNKLFIKQNLAICDKGIRGLYNFESNGAHNFGLNRMKEFFRMTRSEIIYGKFRAEARKYFEAKEKVENAKGKRVLESAVEELTWRIEDTIIAANELSEQLLESNISSMIANDRIYIGSPDGKTVGLQRCLFYFFKGAREAERCINILRNIFNLGRRNIDIRTKKEKELEKKIQARHDAAKESQEAREVELANRENALFGNNENL